MNFESLMPYHRNSVLVDLKELCLKMNETTTTKRIKVGHIIHSQLFCRAS